MLNNSTFSPHHLANSHIKHDTMKIKKSVHLVVGIVAQALGKIQVGRIPRNRVGRWIKTYIHFWSKKNTQQPSVMEHFDYYGVFFWHPLKCELNWGWIMHRCNPGDCVQSGLNLLFRKDTCISCVLWVCVLTAQRWVSVFVHTLKSSCRTQRRHATTTDKLIFCSSYTVVCDLDSW